MNPTFQQNNVIPFILELTVGRSILRASLQAQQRTMWRGWSVEMERAVVGRQAHVKLQEAMQEAGKGIQQVVADVRQECIDIQAASHRVHRMVDVSRRALDRTFQLHVEACRYASPFTPALPLQIFMVCRRT